MLDCSQPFLARSRGADCRHVLPELGAKPPYHAHPRMRARDPNPPFASRSCCDAQRGFSYDGVVGCDPRLRGAHMSHHGARRRGRLAAHGARTAAGNAGGRIPQEHVGRCVGTSPSSVRGPEPKNEREGCRRSIAQEVVSAQAGARGSTSVERDTLRRIPAARKFCFQVGDGLIATRQGAFTWPILVAPDKIPRFF